MKVTSERMKMRICELCCSSRVSPEESINYIRIEGEEYGLITLALCDKCLRELKEKLDGLSIKEKKPDLFPVPLPKFIEEGIVQEHPFCEGVNI